MLRNKIFVTGHPKGSTLEFVKDIFTTSKSKSFPQKLVDDRLKETKGDLVGICIPYEFDTKYYTAKVDFWIDEIDKACENGPLKPTARRNPMLAKSLTLLYSYSIKRTQ
ncbi:unnamed protein product [Mucor hiemalis]